MPPRRRPPGTLYHTEIPERAAVVEASARRLPVVAHAPESLPAESFRWLAEEVES